MNTIFKFAMNKVEMIFDRFSNYWIAKLSAKSHLSLCAKMIKKEAIHVFLGKLQKICEGQELYAL